jgi:diguanylate cyclase (GGDEF)-like protein
LDLFVRRSGWDIRLGAKVFVAIGVLVPAVLTIAVAALLGLGQAHRDARQLYSDSIETTQVIAQLVGALGLVAERSLEEVATSDPVRLELLDRDLRDRLIPRAQEALDDLHDHSEDEAEGEAFVHELQVGFAEYEQLRRSGAYLRTGTDPNAMRLNAQTLRQSSELFVRMHAVAEQRLALEVDHAEESVEHSESTFRWTQRLVVTSVAFSLFLAGAGILWLIRTLVPRIQHYSAFATAVAEGRPAAMLSPSGRDELAELGHALNAMVQQREQLSRYERSQAEFTDTLQITESEEEAHELLQRHLVRELPGSAVLVLKRNNSANRLEPATASIPDNLADRLVGALPRACLALRFARTHREGADREPLLSCGVCAETACETVCEPLLVGGEVIGSVLTMHPEPLAEDSRSRIKNTVAQAAPMLANLRNLAIAEFRANNDSLTGLPNKRAAEDTLKRMVAQANRSLTPLAVILLDLDHFKQINDRYGHAKGDEVLAAVGTSIGSCLRSSDFAGRFGGEEFLILLPETTIVGATVIAERIRNAVSAVVVPELDRQVTASLGVAVLPNHAGHAAGLLRESDHALYAAKAAGRDRVVVAGEEATVAATAASVMVPSARAGGKVVAAGPDGAGQAAGQGAGQGAALVAGHVAGSVAASDAAGDSDPGEPRGPGVDPDPAVDPGDGQRSVGARFPRASRGR